MHTLRLVHGDLKAVSRSLYHFLTLVLITLPLGKHLDRRKRHGVSDGFWPINYTL